jgi:hypothetical protein
MSKHPMVLESMQWSVFLYTPDSDRSGHGAGSLMGRCDLFM